MRQLTKKQKEYLTWRFKEGVRCWGDLSLGQMEVLEEMNNTEILLQEVDRFLWDISWEGGVCK